LHSADFPEQLLSQMATCQTAANEFLRQLWFALFPSSQEMRNPAFSKLLEQREAKAAKMVSYLQSTHEKVEALYPLAQQLNVDATIVEMVSSYESA
jgi:transcription initiation factor TFIIH subunit 1